MFNSGQMWKICFMTTTFGQKYCIQVKDDNDLHGSHEPPQRMTD